jgi:hypothetical protein
MKIVSGDLWESVGEEWDQGEVIVQVDKFWNFRLVQQSEDLAKFEIGVNQSNVLRVPSTQRLGLYLCRRYSDLSTPALALAGTTPITPW